MSAVLPVLLSCQTWAAKWDIVPSLSVHETYTDNLTLTSNELKQADWVTEVIPAISIAATGAGLKFKAIYEPQLVYYARGQNNDQIFQRGNAAGTAELAKQFLFVDAGAKVSQYDASIQGPLTLDNVNPTGNRVTLKTYYVSPYLKREFGTVQGEARITASAVDSSNQSTLSNSVGERVNLNLKSGPTYKILTWDLIYTGEIVDYDTGEYSKAQLVSSNARRLLTPTVGLLAQVGYEYYQSAYHSLDIAPPSTGSSWSGGVEWRPSPRTNITATAGRRLYGNAYLIDINQRSRLTTWHVGYNEKITNARSELFVPSTTSTAGYLNTLLSSQFPDPVTRQKAVDEFIARTGLPPALGEPVNILSTQLFLEKKWQVGVGILGVRNVLMADVFKVTREALVGNVVLPTSGDFAAAGTIRQTGASLLWNLRLTPQTAWNMRAAYSRNDLVDTKEVDNVLYFGMGLSRQFEPRLSGSVSYRRQHSDSNISASYTENAVIAAVQMRF